MKYERLAHDILDLIDRLDSMNNVPATKHLFRWRDQLYFGQIQIPYPNAQPEIAAVSRSHHIIPEGLAESIQKLRATITTLEVRDVTDFTGHFHLLRLKDRTLSTLNLEQKFYLQTHPVAFLDAETIN